MLVHDLLARAAAQWPARTALVCGAKRYTFGELERMANRVANALIAAGVSRGDRTAIYLPNCVEAVVGMFAVLKAGGVFVMVGPPLALDVTALCHNCLRLPPPPEEPQRQ